ACDGDGGADGRTETVARVSAGKVAPVVDDAITIQNWPPGVPLSVASGSVQIEIVYGPRIASVTIGNGGPECARTMVEVAISASVVTRARLIPGISPRAFPWAETESTALSSSAAERRRARVPMRALAVSADPAVRSPAPWPSIRKRRARHIRAESETRLLVAARPSPRMDRQEARDRTR